VEELLLQLLRVYNMTNFKNMDFFRDVAKNELVTGGLQPEHDPYVSQDYKDRMKQLGDDYRNVKWLPLDIPRIELEDKEEFFSIWNTESVDILRQAVCVAEPWEKEKHPGGNKSSWYVPQFKGLTLWNHPMYNLEMKPFTAKRYYGNKQLDRIVEQVFEYFPIHTMWEIFLWESLVPIGPHRDKSSYWNCPTEFRSMIYDENPDPTLFVVDIEKGDKNYIDLPEDTNNFCWSNGTHIHGSDFYGKRKIILCMNGIQHSGKSRELFERSVTKYQSKVNYDLVL
jgi:hypothetical protein